MEATKTGAAAAGSTVMVREGALTVPLVLVADTVKVKTPEAVGVPDSSPVVPFSARPLGSPPDARAKVGAG